MIDMTTWDRYKQELLSGVLEWSPAHKSEKFWKGKKKSVFCLCVFFFLLFFKPTENFARFNDRNFELVGVLAALLASQESQTVAIACHDLGEFRLAIRAFQIVLFS